MMAHEVHQVGRVLAIVDSELRIEPELDRIFPQQPRADPVSAEYGADRRPTG